MRMLLPFLLCLCFMCFPGCRCGRHTSSSLTRTGTGFIDARSRSVSQLWDSLAERQTIRIIYTDWPSFHGMELGSMASDAVTLPPGDGGSREPGKMIKSIEITTERNAGRSAIAIDTVANVSQASTKETLQQEAASETRQDNGTWIGIAVVCAVAAFCYFTWKEVIS